MTTTIQFEPIRFNHKVTPRGFLVEDAACHALYYYSVLARRVQESNGRDPNLQSVRYEGDLDEEYNYRNLFISVARMYGVQPERMEKFWNNIDTQLLVDNHPKLEGAARFEWIATVNSATNRAGVPVSTNAPETGAPIKKTPGGIILP